MLCFLVLSFCFLFFWVNYPFNYSFCCLSFRKHAEEAIQALNGLVIGKQPVRLSWGRSPGNKHVRLHMFEFSSFFNHSVSRYPMKKLAMNLTLLSPVLNLIAQTSIAVYNFSQFFIYYVSPICMLYYLIMFFNFILLSRYVF